MPSLNSSRVETRAFIESISANPPLTYRPRDVILCLSLKLIFDSRAEPLVKYSFGMLRGLYKEFLRNKSKPRQKPPRRSYRNSTQVLTENTELTEFGEFLKQTNEKNLFFRSQSRPESPDESRKSWESSKSNVQIETLQRQTYRSLFKIFNKFLDKHFSKLKNNSKNKENMKNSMKNFVNSLVGLSFRYSFTKILRYSTFSNENNGITSKMKSFVSSAKDSRRFIGRHENRSATVTLNGSNLECLSRRPSFDNKDREIWRKRHPVRFQSPKAIETRPSLFITLNSSESNSPGNPFAETPDLRGAGRRNTVGVLRKFDTFGTTDSGDKNEESQNISKESQEGKKNPKKKNLRAGRPADCKENEENKRNKENDKKNEDCKRKKKIELTPAVKRIIGKMEKGLLAHWKIVKGKVLLKLTQAVQDEKNARKKNAAGLLADLSGFRIRSCQKKLKHSAFQDIKKEAKEKPLHISPKEKSEMKKPPKKPILRSGNSRPEDFASKPIQPLSLSPKPLVPDQSLKAKKFLKTFDWLKTKNLKNKLLGFLKITENSGKQKNLSNFSKGLRSIFRVLEAKKFSTTCRVFHNVKRYSSQRSHVLQKKYIIFAQKLSKIFSYALKSRTFPAFSKIFASVSILRAGKKLGKALEKIENRAKLGVKPLVWYRISSYMKKKQCDYKVRSIKLDYLIRKVYIRKLAYSFV
jgi:hypothetical protein